MTPAVRVLGLLLLVSACVADVSGTSRPSSEQTDETGSGSGSNQTSVTATGYLERIAQIYCDQSFQCRTTFPPDRGYTFEAQWGNTIPECKQRLLDAWAPVSIETEIAKGRVVYDGAAAVECLDGVAFAACPDYWVRGIEWAESCYQVMVGQVPTAGACELDYACVSYDCDEAAHRCL